ncbi:MAG: PAS domain-containing protein, partial [Desulfatitalea sp.]|nr:PAS domain-containing protein [Desulfatitalea sp.]NNK01911.1 PAS domain-containing protein [Desulfatitalea sp.]
AKQSLEDTSAFANEVVTHLPVGLIATDPQGRVSFFNAAAEQITGIARTSAIGGDPHTFLPENLFGLQQVLKNGETVKDREMVCEFNPRRTVPLSVSATRIVNADGAAVAQMLILRDLGEVRQLQAQLRRQEKLAALGGLAAGVAHEIRNPLSSIKGLATYFEGQFAAGSESRQAAAVMIQEVDRLNRVITELLDFARPTDLNRQATDPAALIADAIRLIGQDAANQQVIIEEHIDNRLCRVWVDPDRLAQCLLNLMLNALQAMPGGGCLAVSCRAAENETVQIIIQDTGRGIAADHLQKIFDPYFTTKNKGTGLGLAVVQKIIAAHDAHIHVESTPGNGATFQIQLPCRAPAPDRGEDAA